MDFFNNLGKTLSEKSRDAAKKAKDMADIVRINGQISAEEDKVLKSYQAIGKAYYELHRQDEDDPFAGHFMEIEEAEAKIAQYKAEVQKLKGSSVCPSCGAEVKMGTLYCANCGGKLFQSMDASQTETVTGTVEDSDSSKDQG